MNSFLESVPLLYFLFFITLVHLGYFMMLKDYQSIFIFCLASIFVYLVIPNMVVVLALTLLFVDLLYLIQRKVSKEGFSMSGTLEDMSGVDISANDFIENTTKTITEEDMVDYDISNNNTADVVEPYQGNVLEEVDEQSEKMKKMLDKLKTISPELLSSLSMLNSIDISELNKLINNVNKIASTFSS